MRSLEIYTQRVFNNLIKQNQKLDSDSVLKQSRKVSRVQTPESCVQSPESTVQHPESSIQSAASRVQRPEYSVQGTAFRVRIPASRVQSPRSSAEYSVRRQRPVSRVHLPTIASRNQKPIIKPNNETRNLKKTSYNYNLKANFDCNFPFSNEEEKLSGRKSSSHLYSSDN